ncbi:glycosyltransferase [Agromyces mangrovi Wang et al. 2018]|uniref:glycosyltransferase n=1 Tax=Agromyces mangrovi TaxID=1858653 RepID=UPI0025723753|nr:glycosyltransferase [Agromyces mangrovi]BDZ65205.1 glycosyl transferase [Agromyces mangrovi]
MRILVATTANLGHFLPTVALARACAAAGHEVRVAAPGSFAPAVAGAGLAFAPVGDPDPAEIGRTFGSIAHLPMMERDARVVADVFGRIDARAALPAMSELLDGFRPDLVLRDPAEIASLVAAEVRGAPHATVAIGTTSMLGLFAERLAEPLAEFEAEHGLAAGRLTGAAAAAPRFTRVPASFDDPPAASDPTVVRFRDGDADAVPEAAPLPEWGDAGAPLVYVSFGTVAGNFPDAGDRYRRALDGLADVPVRVLLTTGSGFDPEALRPWPGNALVERWRPQAEVLPHAAAVVGHGGFGTTTAALAAGLPQVVVPLFAFDQHLNAERVADRGVGVRVADGPELAHGLREAVASVLGDPEVAATARRVADEMAALPTAPEVVPGLLAVAAGRADA